VRGEMAAGREVTVGHAHRGGLRAVCGRHRPRASRRLTAASAGGRIVPGSPHAGRVAAVARPGPGRCRIRRPGPGPHAGDGGRHPGSSGHAALAYRGPVRLRHHADGRPADGRPADGRARRASGSDLGSGSSRRTRPLRRVRPNLPWIWHSRLHRRDRLLLRQGAGQKMTYTLRIVSWICQVPAQPRGKTAVLPGPISCGEPPSGVTVIRPDTTYTNSLVSSFQ